MRASGRNIKLAMAWQSGFAAPASATDAAWTFNSASGSVGPIGVEAPDHRALMGADGDAIDPDRGAHDVSGTWELPLCARQSGLWLRGLFGDAASTTTAGSRGGLDFAAQAIAGDTITVGATTLTFVAADAGINEVLIGATISDTIDAVTTAIDDLDDLTATRFGQLVLIEHMTADATGDAIVTGASAAHRMRPIAATLKGGGMTRHHFTDRTHQSRPFATIEREHSDLTGANAFRVVDSQIVRALNFPRARSGQATMRADVLARYDARSATRSLSATPTALRAEPFSMIGGRITVDGACIGTIDSAALELGVDVTADGFDACGLADAGVIGEPVIGDTTAKFDITARFPTGDLMDAAFNASHVSVQMVYASRSSGAMLILDVPRVFCGRPGETFNGRSSVTAAFTGEGYVDTDAGYRYAATYYSPVAAFS